MLLIYKECSEYLLCLIFTAYTTCWIVDFGGERDRKSKQLTAVVMLNYWLDYTWHPCPPRPAGKHRKTLSLHVSPRAPRRYRPTVCSRLGLLQSITACTVLSGPCVFGQLIVRQINRSDWEVMYEHGHISTRDPSGSRVESRPVPDWPIVFWSETYECFWFDFCN